MKLNARPFLAATAALLPLFPAPAQQQQAGKDARQLRLQRALQTTMAQESIAFRTAEKRDLAVMRGQGRGRGRVAFFAGPGFGNDASADGVAGVWTPELLFATCNDGGDELVVRGSRTIARRAKGTWKFRGRRLADGSSAPRLVDPHAFLTALAESDCKVIHSEVGTRDDRPIELITVALSGDAVAELMWGGFLPQNGTDGVFFAPGGAGPKPDAALDICFVLDPATGLIHEIRCRSYGKSAAGGGMGVVMLAAPAARVVVEEVEEEEPAKEAKPAAKEKKPTPKGEPGREKPSTAASPVAKEGKPKAADPKAEKKAEKAEPVLRAPEFAVSFGVGDSGEIDDEQAIARPPTGFTEGLPVRDKDQRDVVDFTIVLSKHGTAADPDLDARARRLLGLSPQ